MTKTALKKKLIKKIGDLNNQETLKEVMRLVDLYSEMDGIVKLSPDQKKAIKKAQNEIKNGKFYTASQVEKRLSKWLNA